MENFVANDETRKMSISSAKLLLPPRNENGGSDDDDEDEEMPNEQQQQQMVVDIEDETEEDDEEEDEEEFGVVSGSTPKYLTRHFIKKISPLDIANKVATSAARNAQIEAKNGIMVRGTTMEANPLIKVQKKRGRKKKIITDDTNRKKRGRPPKIRPTENNNTTSSSQSESATSSSSANAATKKTTKMSNHQKLQPLQAMMKPLAMKKPTANVNQNNVGKNFTPSRNHNFNIGTAGHYWAEYPITVQQNNSSTTTNGATTSSNAEKEVEEEDTDKLPRPMSKKELDAIRFAGINPLIVLCEAATRQQEQANNLIRSKEIPLQNGHGYGHQQEVQISSNSSTTSSSSSSGITTKTTTTSTNKNKRRHNWTAEDAWGNEDNFVVVDDGVASTSKSPPPPLHPSHHIFDPAPSSIEEEEAADQRQLKWPPRPNSSSVLHYPADSSDRQGDGGDCCSRAASNSHDDNDVTCQYRMRLMSSIEARDHLTVVCLNAICNGEKLVKMRVLDKKKKARDKDEDDEDDDVPFNFSLPKACLEMLTPAAIESLIEIVYEWIHHHWIRTIDGRLGAELKQFSRIDQMRWILVFVIPQLCIYYLNKVRKISVEEAKQQFLAMESTDDKFN